MTPTRIIRSRREYLRKAGRWFLEDSLSWALPAIRCEIEIGAPACPITAMVEPARVEAEATEIGRALGLSYGTIYAIMDAADGVEGHDPAIRRALLEATGIE